MFGTEETLRILLPRVTGQVVGVKNICSVWVIDHENDNEKSTILLVFQKKSTSFSQEGKVLSISTQFSRIYSMYTR